MLTQGQQEEQAPDSTAARRRTRFGTLPEPVRLEDTVEEKAATVPDPTRDAYHPDEWMVRYSL